MLLFDNLNEKISKQQVEKFGKTAKKVFQNAAKQERIQGITSAAKKISRNVVDTVSDVWINEFEKGDRTSNQNIQA